jgi:hypothetical protein
MVHGPNRANRQQLTGDRHRKSIIFLRPARLEPGLTSRLWRSPAKSKRIIDLKVSARCVFSRLEPAFSRSLEQAPKEKARCEEAAAGKSNYFRR